VHSRGTPRSSEPLAVLLPRVRVVYPPDGRNDTRRKADLTMWIITRVQPPGWILGDRRLSVLWARMARAHLYSPRLFHNLVLCRLDGKCDLRQQRACTLLITTPKRLHGTIRG